MGSIKAMPGSKFIAIQVYCKKTRKTSNRQPNLTPKTTGKRRRTTIKKLVQGKKSKIWAEIHEEEMIEMKEKIVRINKTKSYFFEKINKIDKSLARLKKKREKNQIYKIRNEKGEITTDNPEI